MALKEVGVKLVVEGGGKFKATMKGADQSMESFGDRIQKVAPNLRALGAGMTVFGGIISGVLGLAVKQASDAEEMMSKFRVVFRDQAPEVEMWAETLSRAVNRSRFEIMEMAAALQDTFVPMGFARDQAASLSKDLTALAIDVASFNNKLDADVLRDFQSALVGNTETVRKYGIVITAAAIEQDILDRGLVETKSDITEAMKVQARYNMIVAGSADAIGDAERTSGSFANTMKGLKANIQETAVTIGQALLPILSNIIGRITAIVKQVSDWMSRNKALSRIIVIATAAVGGLMLVLGPLLIALPSLITGFTILRTFLLAKLIPTIVATTVALWAKVAALFAILAAAGPVGWAILAAGIALIGTTAVLVAHQIQNALKGVTSQQQEFNEQVNDGRILFGILAEEAERGSAVQAHAARKAQEAQEAQAQALLEAQKILNDALREELRIRKLLQPAVELVRGGILTPEAFFQLEKQARAIRATAIQGGAIPGFAQGGVSPGGTALVGERGPELVSLPPGAIVRPITNSTTFNVDATYTNPQEPASIALDLEALTMLAQK